jgi:NAD(P)-dependent dehydrogenase (short-subunit alcohol dehydrogenase family)
MTQSAAIVTGAAGDIGAAIAARLAEDHDVVLLADINAAAAAAMASKLGPDNRFVAVGCDVTSEASIAELAKRAADIGVVRTLVNNAGAARATSLHDTTPEIWRADNALNLEAAFLCFRAFEPMLKVSKGSVVNIASVNGLHVFEEARRWYPLQRVVDPQDVANAVAFLAGPLAAAITGVCLPVDCGLTAGQAELARTFSQSEHY